MIADIVRDSLHENYDNSLYLSLGQQWPDGFLVAADALGRPVGFLLGVMQVDHEGRILMFAVDRAHRARGIGTQLMQAFLERCRTQGLRRVTLEVRVSNATAIRFYTDFPVLGDRPASDVLLRWRGRLPDGPGHRVARPAAPAKSYTNRPAPETREPRW